ncbi:hypothetical protein [Coleofasciculus sp.]|uniref:hypothetical protein n=1 Tax=Coleofasciculus sp. TaxID=3100458 RepID=UPI004062ED48
MTEDDIQLQIDTANPDPQDTTYLQNLKPQLKQLSADSLISDLRSPAAENERFIYDN